MIASCKSILFDRKRVGISASSNNENISDSVCTLLIRNVPSKPSEVDCSKSTISGSKVAEVEAVEVEAAKADATGVEVAAAEVEAAKMEAAEVRVVEVEPEEVETSDVWECVTVV